jgi:hypothetical protein
MNHLQGVRKGGGQRKRKKQKKRSTKKKKNDGGLSQTVEGPLEKASQALSPSSSSKTDLMRTLV